VEERDAPVDEVVRREDPDPRGTAGAGDRGAEPGGSCVEPAGSDALEHCGLANTGSAVDELVATRRDLFEIPGRGGTKRAVVSEVARSASARAGSRRASSSSVIPGLAFSVLSDITTPRAYPVVPAVTFEGLIDSHLCSDGLPVPDDTPNEVGSAS
jgi:hypothetical protein